MGVALIIDELIAILGYDVRGESELARFNQGMDRAAQRAEQVASRINAINVAIGTFVGQMAYGAVTRLSSAIGSFPGQVIQTGKTFEALTIRLNTLEGSSDKAEKAMGWIRQFAKDTPLELAQVADAYANLKNFGLDPTNGSLLALTDAMSASGKGVQMLDRLVLAFGQAWVKEKLQGQEILQMTEAGIPVWEMLGEALGKTSTELQKMAAKGQIGRKEIELLIDAVGKKYKGASDEFSKSVEGITSKLGDEWTEFLLLVSKKGFYDDIKRRLEGVAEVVQRWDKDGTLERAATAISNFMTGSLGIGGHVANQLLRIGRAAASVAGEVTGLVERLTGLNTTMSGGLLGAALLSTTTMGRAMMGWLAKRAPMIAGALLLDDIIGGLSGDKSYIGSLEGGQAALEGLRAGWNDLAQAAQGLSNALEDLFRAAGFAGGNTIFSDPDSFISSQLIATLKETRQLFQEIAAVITAFQQGDYMVALGILTSGVTPENLAKIRELQLRKQKTSDIAGEERMLQDVEGRTPGEIIERLLDGTGRERAGAKGDRLGQSTEPDRRRFGAGAATGTQALQNALDNFVANMRRADGAAQAVIEDHSVDARDQSVNVQAPVSITVQQATQAPGAAADGIAGAIRQAVPARSQLEVGPSTP